MHTVIMQMLCCSGGQSGVGKGMGFPNGRLGVQVECNAERSSQVYISSQGIIHDRFEF